MKSGMLQEKKSKTAGLQYESGIANKPESAPNQVDGLQADDFVALRDKEFDTFDSIL